jgi:outer membrane protein OmpA-like peptidoglycan-associated protein
MAHAAESHESHGTHAAAAAPESRREAIIPFLATLALTAIILWALLSARPVAAPTLVAAAPPPAAGSLGAMVERSLAGGARVVLPERGVEWRLLAFIEDPAAAADKTTWFDFDRLTFETASAALGAGSQEQLAAVAAILSAYPAVKLKLGGYTDNVGDPAANLKLSQERADSVMGALVKLGVAPDRLSAEGYGEQFPVGDNATPEGRAMNRRISMRVAEK